MEGLKATPLPQFINDKQRRPFLVVSYFTVKTDYEKEVLNLIRSLEKWRLDYKITGIYSKGGWFQNIAYRPIFIKNTRAELPDRPLVWLDADAVVQQDPVLFDKLGEMGYDMAVHYKGGKELLGGTIWFSTGPMINRLIDLWVDYQKYERFKKEQQNLQEVLRTHKEFRIYNLPATYTQIFDLMKDAGDPVIEHFQASRRFKRLLNLGQGRRF